MNIPLERFPKALPGQLTLRPMNASDEAALIAFFKRIPVEERQLFREDVTRLSMIQGWIRNLDYGRVLPLLVFRGQRIVADATLHRDQGGWSRHLGKLRLTLDPEFRRQGLARRLLQELIALAKPLGVAVMEAEILDVQEQAALLLEDMGFQHVATLPQHAIDLAGRVHDLRVYSQTISLPEGLAPEAKLAEEDADVGGG
ncbi:MAG: GNAT family N-acetyltransferase [Planctomycetes bacterium]|nr:GNAT family N-acetyltransferase [Planctomycetota bacterium]